MLQSLCLCVNMARRKALWQQPTLIIWKLKWDWICEPWLEGQTLICNYPPQAIKGLSEDGLTPQESAPQQLMQTDMQSAQRIIAFCELPAEYQRQAAIERWDGIPPISEDYKEARDVIIERLHHLMKK